jgi:hypothetical protein
MSLEWNIPYTEVFSNRLNETCYIKPFQGEITLSNRFSS